MGGICGGIRSRGEAVKTPRPEPSEKVFTHGKPPPPTPDPLVHYAVGGEPMTWRKLFQVIGGVVFVGIAITIAFPVWVALIAFCVRVANVWGWLP